MPDQDKRQPLAARELQTLLITGQAMSHEQDEERICHWVCDAAASLLGASFASIILRPAEQDSPEVVYGKLGDSPLSKHLTNRVAELARMEWPAPEATGGVATLQRAKLPPGLTRRKISQLLRVDVATIQQELGVLLVGKEVPMDLDSRDRFVLATLANEAALALENTRLRREANEQSQALRALIQASPLPIIARDRNAKVQMWNPAAERTFGWSEEEVLGSPYPLVPADKQNEFRANMERASRGDPLTGLETQRQRKDGTLIDVSIWTAPLPDGGAMVVLADLTERERSAEVLRESEEKFHRIFDYSNDAIFLIDPEREAIVDVNPRACDMLGFSRQELLSLGVSSIHPNEMPQLQAFARSVFEQGRGWTNQLTCLTKSGTYLPSEISASTVEIGGQTLLVAMIRDTTERQQAEETSRELAVLGERNRLAREIHDTLAQGLTAILWQINAAEHAVAEGGPQALEYLDRLRGLAREGLQDARRSVWDLRLGPLEGRTLSEALRGETERVAGAGEIQISFAVSGEEKVLPSGAEAALLRICQESLANMVKHSQATQSTVTLAYNDGQVRLAVQDNGIGFDPDIPGTRSKESGGFGLINMRERVRLLGGELTVRSQPGRGTLVEASLSLK